MKIKMQGSELKKVDIEFLSLVKRGANRAPFKVVKADAPAPDRPGLIGAVTKFFQMSEPAPKVVAVFVQKAALTRAVPNLALSGFRIDDSEIQDDCVVFKQDGFADCAEVTMIKSEATVGFAIGNVQKFADAFGGSLAFDPSVASTGFYPGVNEAMRALQAKVNVEKTDTVGLLKSFEAYVSQVTKILPDSIAQFESRQRGFASDTLEALEPVTKAATVVIETLQKAMGNGGKDGGIQDTARELADTEWTPMLDASDGNSGATELAGTADDSPDTEASRRAKMAKSAQTEPVETDMGTAVKADGKVVTPVAKGGPGMPSAGAATKVPKEQTPGWDADMTDTGIPEDPDTKDTELNDLAGGMKKSDIETILKSLATLPALVTALAKSVETQSELLQKSNSRIDAIEKTAKEAVVKAERNVVHVGTDYDSAYENLGGGQRPIAKRDVRTPEQVRKAQFPDSLWEGSLGVLESHIPGVESV